MTKDIITCVSCGKQMRFKGEATGDCPFCHKPLFAGKAPTESPPAPPQKESGPLTPVEIIETVEAQMTNIQATSLESFMVGFESGFGKGYDKGFDAGREQVLAELEEEALLDGAPESKAIPIVDA